MYCGFFKNGSISLMLFVLFDGSSFSDVLVKSVALGKTSSSTSVPGGGGLLQAHDEDGFIIVQ